MGTRRLGVEVGGRHRLLWVVLPLFFLLSGRALGQPVLGGKATHTIDWESEFYYSQLLTPADLARQNGASYTLERLPNSWTRYHLATGEHLPARGYATYRVRCLVKNPGHSQILGLYIPYVRSSYALWINGAEMPGVGVVSSVPHEAWPGVAQSLVPFTVEGGVAGEVDTVEIVLQVSNYVSPGAGLVDAMRVGDYETLAEELLRAQTWVALLAGALLMLLAANLVLYALRRTRRVNVWISVLLFFVVLVVTTSERSQFLLVFPSVSWDVYHSLRAAVRLCSMSALLMLLRRQYPYEFAGRLAYPLVALGGLLALLVLLLPARLYLRAEWVGVAYLAVGFAVAIFWVLLRAAKCRRSLSRRILVGLVVVGLSVLADYLGELFWQPVPVSFSLLAVAVLSLLLIRVTILDISHSLSRMRTLMGDMRNDYHTYRGENIRLAEALRREQAERARLEADSLRRQWSDEGQRRLRKVLIENHENLGALCQKSLEEVSRYVKSKVGVLYVARLSASASELELQLYASYGLDESQRAARATCALGEGVLGASFLDNTPRVLEDVPKTSVKINSGLGRAVPRSLIVQPLESDAGLVGVLELGRFASYEEHEVSFVRRCASQIANSIMHSSSREDSRRQIAQLQEALQSRG